MSRRNPIKAKRPTKITIPQRAGPHVRLVFGEMQRQNVTYDDVEDGSGVLRTTLKAWRHKNKPGLESIEAVLGFLGWDFVPVPRAKVLPAALLSELGPLAERHGTTLAVAAQALVEIVSGIHDGLPPPKEEPAVPTPRAKVRTSRAHPDQTGFFIALPDGAIEIARMH